MLAIIRQFLGWLLRTRTARELEPLPVRVIRPAIVNTKKRKADESWAAEAQVLPTKHRIMAHMRTESDVNTTLRTQHAQGHGFQHNPVIVMGDAGVLADHEPVQAIHHTQDVVMGNANTTAGYAPERPFLRTPRAYEVPMPGSNRPDAILDQLQALLQNLSIDKDKISSVEADELGAMLECLKLVPIEVDILSGLLSKIEVDDVKSIKAMIKAMRLDGNNVT